MRFGILFPVWLIDTILRIICFRSELILAGEKKLVELAKRKSCHAILDLATGSGDVAFALQHGLGTKADITGLDFCEPMLKQARQKRDHLGLDSKKICFHGRGLSESSL
jgi:demethylmenaquinone methyltransferase/2-methoxy-6-polyprenyl-1,4-benzoquinol methylase